MISIHAAGVLRLVFSRFGNSSRSGRVFVGFLLWAALVVCAYFPACNWTANHWLMPLRVGERVLVINRFARCSSVRPGELIAYRIAADQSQPITVAAGFGVDRVLARPGDRVRFTPVDVQVNGVPQPRLPGMPVGAEFVLAEKEWFVWPRLSIYQAYSADPRAVAARVRLGIIDETKYLGRPFQRWFGRRQSIP